jgi:nicotinamidase-related amidase
MAIWDDLLSEHEREVYGGAGYEKRIGFGKRPALLIIDMTYSFLGDKPEPVAESIKRFPQSCGEVGWKAIQQLTPLLPLARAKGVPLIYTDRTHEIKKPVNAFSRLVRKWDDLSFSSPEMGQAERGHCIVKEIAPELDDIIIFKEGASAFFGTQLISLLISHRIDTLLVCGTTTSGCVRASVIDAAQYGLKVSVIQEGVFDRIELSHKVNLFDMNAKYADVISIDEAKDYLTQIPDQ